MFPRSRLVVVLGVVGCALAILLRDSFASLAILGAALVVAVVNLLLTGARLYEMRRRPPAFVISGGRFAARFLFAQEMFSMVTLVILGTQIGSLVHTFEDPDPAVRILAWVMLVPVAFLGALTIALAALVWSMAIAGVELTPEGVTVRTIWDRRIIPWEALALGGPLRPGHRDYRIRLVFDRPELVRRRRIHLPGKGNRISTQLEVHPWFVADALRWYVEHPEHRAAIGTEAEHARLLIALGADTMPAVSVPEPPPAVRGAIKAAYAGVAFGLLTAVLDVALVFAYSDRLIAWAVEKGEREVREFGVEPSDWESGVRFSQSWFVIALVLAGLAATVAVLSIRFLKQGNQVGRTGLIVVSTAAMIAALVPCFEVAAEPPPGLGTLFVTVAVVKHLGYLALGATTLACLLAPSTSAYLQPNLQSGPA